MFPLSEDDAILLLLLMLNVSYSSNMLVQMVLSRSNRGGRGPYCCLTQRSILLEYLHNQELDFKHHFRITRESFRELMNQLWADLPTRTHGWSREVHLLVFLFWLACGTSYRVVGACFNVPRTTTFRMVTSALNLMTRQLDKMVYFPKQNELPQIAAGFKALSGNDRFDGFVGAIDGCHVRIQAPESLPQDYFCRKQFYSIQLQAVCDHRGIFLDIFTGYPGSVHDARVLRNSPIYVGSLYPPVGYAILGDSGYQNLTAPITITTPFKDTRSPVEIRFNKAHAKARCIVERAFGLMKGRWRSVFTKALEVSVRKAPDVVAACAAMHNVCMRMHDEAPEELSDDDTEPDTPDDDVDETSNKQNSSQFRNDLAARLSCPTAAGDHDYHVVI
ncbi:hypothetical protein V5799_033534 [Amblyomma americanum]|uniref:Putative nuclease HARBI1 n=1 Tax=Amblyomma americanum TaxID=6943 RepID=A0AAQ4DN17_AMBAM